MLRFLTAGESHGPELTVIVDGLPAGLPLRAERLDRDLRRRQQGYGRGGRMRIEHDRVRLTAGVRHGRTLGSPLALVIENRDWPNWQETMNPEPPARGDRPVTRPRPGHADLAGVQKYGLADVRSVLERASARETAARTAAGAVAKCLLEPFGVGLGSWVERIGSVVSAASAIRAPERLASRAERSDVRCPWPQAAASMRRAIDRATRTGDTLGGVFTVAAWGLPPGLGGYAQWDRRLDASLAAALMSIPAIKGVEIGLGFEAAARPGSRVHDAITYRTGDPFGGFGRRTNHAGGLEGGMTTGQPLLARAAMKPIATLRRPLASVDLTTRRARAAGYERSDVCAVPAAAVVGEAMVAWALAQAWLDKFGGDSLEDMRAAHRQYLRRLDRG